MEYNEYSSFDGPDSGYVTSTANTPAATISGLTPGRTYFVRVLAKTTVGSGAFCANGGSDCLSAAVSVAAKP